MTNYFPSDICDGKSDGKTYIKLEARTPFPDQRRRGRVRRERREPNHSPPPSPPATAPLPSTGTPFPRGASYAASTHAQEHEEERLGPQRRLRDAPADAPTAAFCGRATVAAVSLSQLRPAPPPSCRRRHSLPLVQVSAST
ncbi:hypothetical protein PIB30_104919 [Stylosanthes scabra]|uniref:Uncharacterized protein n=1 Tax=Stylosanthes scabra TaxID=79078 RepID=A0ABU6UZN9_9FABA|nr:hypothetical protein [Stylosanthes scabra]